MSNFEFSEIPKSLDLNTMAININNLVPKEPIIKSFKIDEQIEEFEKLNETTANMSKDLEVSKAEIKKLQEQLNQMQDSHKHDFLKNLLLAITSAVVTYVLTQLPKIISIIMQLQAHKLRL